MSLKVLLADESPTIKKAFDIALKDYGVKIQSVHQGHDVKELCLSFKPDICFIDALIPKLNGYETSAQIKEDDTISNTPTVIMWSGFMELDDEKFESSKADGHIEKPFETKELRDLVQKLVPFLGSNEISKHLIPDALSKSEIFGSDVPEFNEENAPKLSNREVTGEYDLDDLESAASDFSVENLSDISKTAAKEDSGDFGGLDDIDDFKVETLDSDNDDDIFGDLSSNLESAKKGDDIEDIFNLSPLEDDDESSLPPTPEAPAGFDFNKNNFTDENDEADLDLSLPPLEDDLPLETSRNDDAPYLNDVSELEENNNFSTPPPAPAEVMSQSYEKPAAQTNQSSEVISDEKLFKVDEKDGIPKLSKDELKRLILAQSKDIIESVVWDVVPELARELIQKEISKLMGKAEKDNLDGDLR